ncbi:unnamed protein product [Rangifer tarandus platyrhynchus]|uniref:Uncharacterized protein n=2 Tax=Rangifer tarandus platyrhynchus TaxID=3082113 RepID=A0AC59YRQ9_RANTA|nr:unnamed protein product [Rangifer tarandus platyrhynchus]
MEAPPSEPRLNLMTPEGPTPKCHHTRGSGFNIRMLWRGDTNIRSITLESTWMLFLSRWLQSWSGPRSKDRPTWVLPAQPPPFHPTPEITAVSPLGACKSQAQASGALGPDQRASSPRICVPGLTCSVTQSCQTPWDPIDCSTPGFPVLPHLPDLAQTHVH